jgi:hypothetical protein
VTGTAHELAEKIAGEMSIPPGAVMTEEQAAGFRERFQEAIRDGSLPGARFLPPGPLLTPETARELLRECVTVVKPGETLVIRSRDWNPEQAEYYQEYLGHMADAGEIPFRPLVVIGDEVAVVQPASDADLSARIRKLLPPIIEHERLRRGGRPRG